MKRLTRYKFRQTTIQLIFFIGILAGLGLSRIYTLQTLWLIILIPIALASARKKNIYTIVAISLLAIGLGCWRGLDFAGKTSVYNNLQNHKITISARAMNDAVYGKSKQLSFDANNVVLEDGTKLTGKIQLSGFGLNAVFQGDEVRATGSFYHGYGAYQASMSFATLSLVQHNPSPIVALRQKFTAGMQSALPEPLAPFAMGLLVGQRATLPPEIKQDLLMVGLTHIIAVSGYNLTIILHASKRLFAKSSKRISAILAVTLIAVFLLLAGQSASIVRAAIVSMLSIWATHYGHTFKPLNLIVFVAAVTAWLNPVYVWSDLSWYLSFLAFFGVMVLSPLVQKRWPARWHSSLVGGVALESICAEIMSLPFILYIFGQMSLVGLLANVLVVTLVPLAMFLSLIAGIAGMCCATISGWLSWPALFLLDYMLDLSHWLAALPHVFVQDRYIALPITITFYALICLICAVLWNKTKPTKAVIITDINQPEVEGDLA